MRFAIRWPNSTMTPDEGGLPEYLRSVAEARVHCHFFPAVRNPCCRLIRREMSGGVARSVQHSSTFDALAVLPSDVNDFDHVACGISESKFGRIDADRSCPSLMYANVQTARFRNRMRCLTLACRRSKACQLDATEMANMAVFPVSRYGQRNGSRAPHLSASISSYMRAGSR